MALTIPYFEFEFTFTRSRGPGGQNVNKTNSAAQLRWSLIKTQALLDSQKSRLFEKLGNKLIDGEYILIHSDTHRDQESNKSECIRKLNSLLEKSLAKPKFRVPTKPTRSSVRKRLDSKKKDSEVKTLRSKIKV